MNETNTKEMRGQINILNEMCSYIADAVYYAVVVSSKDEYNINTEEIERSLAFSRGTRNYKVSINWCGEIIDTSPKIPSHMITDIHNAICGKYLNGILEQSKKEFNK